VLSHDEIHYRLNDRDEIVFVNKAWDAFASTNSGEHLTAAKVLGQPLWGFIRHHDTTLVPRRSGASSERSSCSVQLPVRLAGLSQAARNGRIRWTRRLGRVPSPDYRSGRAAAATATRPGSTALGAATAGVRMVQEGGRRRPLGGSRGGCFLRMATTVSAGEGGAEPLYGLESQEGAPRNGTE
jgi:hypothetical protein